MIQHASDTILEVRNLYKSFNNADKTQTDVICDLSFSVSRGEFLTILGASGCGKTTLLRILCGLETVDRGQVILNGADITDTEPHTRPVNTVFQSYALFPHMTVWDNIAYPLKLRRLPKTEIRERVDRMLALVQMTGYEKRYPAVLSGGQRQRIAIARSLIGEPQVLLLDEPLGALDFHLRRRMQSELKRMQQTLGITFIYITHDQEEALNMSDRIAVMHGGRFLQMDTPQNLYDTPADTYVARFVGEANLLPCRMESCNSTKHTAVVSFHEKNFTVRTGKMTEIPAPGAPVTVSLRSETLQAAAPSAADDEVLTGVITDISFAGGVQHITFQCGDIPLTTAQYGMQSALSVGAQLRCVLRPLAGVLVSDKNEVRT